MLFRSWFAPYIDWSKGVYLTLFHDQAWVQLIHRLNAYLVLVVSVILAGLLSRRCHDDSIKTLARITAGAVCFQAALGVATLWTLVNIWLGLAHQFFAIIVLILSVVLTWQIFRADRVFRRSGF